MSNSPYNSSEPTALTGTAHTQAPKWTYSRYRSMLRFNGNNFAIVTPDLKNALDDVEAKTLLDALNSTALAESEAREAALREALKTYRNVFKRSNGHIDDHSREELSAHISVAETVLAVALSQLPTSDTPNADTARLDWLEKTDGEVHSDMGAGDGPSTWYAYRKSGNRNELAFKCFSAPTIRAAIDAARSLPAVPPTDEGGQS